MKSFVSSTWIAALLALAACRSAHDVGREELARGDSNATIPVDEPRVSETVVAEDAKPQAASAALLSEAEFEALHKQPTNLVLARHGQMIDLGGSRAYLSLPANAQAPLPGVIVMHEWWGLNANIVHWTDRLAAEGYAAIAVDLYGGIVTSDTDVAYSTMQAIDATSALQKMLAAQAFLKSDARIRAPRTASIGWSLGGTQTLQLALASSDLDAAVVYYGNPIVDPTQLAPMHAELLGIFGTRDLKIPTDKVIAFQSALTSAHKTATIRWFDAEHGFANPSDSRYDEVAATEAWTVVRAFLKSKLMLPRS